MEKKYTYEEFLEIIAQLRSENGCPWDKEQTHESLKACLLEESYELVDAIQNKDITNMREELGDVLLQVVMHAQIAKEANEFTMEDVVNDIASKMVYRHPHVFGEMKDVNTAEDVLVNWEKLKQEEKNEETPLEAMERVAKALPALTRGQKVYRKAKKSKLINEDVLGTISAMRKRLETLENTLQTTENVQFDEEIGNLLLDIVKLSTFFNINAEFALTKSVEKFINRFRYIEN
ncbi:nucleoside triphosphate pyrophosphohydrolase [Cellulosilyticum ruminicola]|uniref:nucleoside triphosphate pyrophosphohydrolase n=1 Tax=Cellulosilyticum ruminicola TaxID=425254 RepID=UPI0009FA1F05|nr:nucleoside triphosphate pyrophosphohydrolase [Cellulosilyticum ruminicola]